MDSIYQDNKTMRTAGIYKLITNISNSKKRNLLRGYSAKPKLSSKEIELVRKGNSAHDNVIVGAVLKGNNGLLDDTKKSSKKTSGDLFTLTSFPSIDWRGEIQYTAGYINSSGSGAVEMLGIIKSFVGFETMETDCALKILFKLSQTYGASNYLSYKLAYLKTSRVFSARQSEVVSAIENEILHRENASFLFSALENVSPQISLFVVAQRRISGLVSAIDGDFRKAISLSNFIPTPLDEKDVSGFLLRATESCFLDTVYAILIIFNLEENLGGVCREFKQHLDKDFLEQLLAFKESIPVIGINKVITDYYRRNNNGIDLSLDLYRISSAFLENPKFAIYRSKFDRVIGVRLLDEIIDRAVGTFSKPLNDKELLLADNTISLFDNTEVPLDTFNRTFLFLKFISNANNLLNISSDEIKFVFENTLGLETLITEKEMRKLVSIAPTETHDLITVLALALFRKKSIDPDIDYEFRADFISHVNKMHNGSIIGFIDALLIDAPQVANYIVESLDEVTLEKMYTLVKNASEASEIRCDILRALGQKLNRIEYFIEADAITTRSKVSQLVKYFDSSRMYVDSVSMKKWLDSNPTIPVQEYRSLHTKIEARLAIINSEGNDKTDLLIVSIADQGQYLITQIAKDAFEQFCLNPEFGIQSYLGRRIRHNTLDGVITGTVHAVLRKNDYKSVVSNTAVSQTVSAWLASYKTIVDKLRKVHLQFTGSGSLFKSNLDLEDSTTKENIRKLTNTLNSAGTGELLNDFVIAFCWQQITPQLDHAARFIKITLLQEANDSIDKYFSGHCSALEEQMKLELHEAVNEVFKKIADWFQVPETGFVPASVHDLCQIIQLELKQPERVEYSGDAVDIKYTGISVHRLYDCLAVLLQNAQKHGKDATTINVSANANRVGTESNLDKLIVRVKSIVTDASYDKSKDRVLQAIDSAERGIDMVTEGYSGIKKIKFITRTSEGSPTISCSVDDRAKEIELSFMLHAETESINSTLGTES